MNKNNCTGNHLTEKVPIKHLLLIMRTTFILLFTCVFCSLAEFSYTQNAKVTIDKRNASLKEVLNEIEKQTDYLFIYNNEVNTNEKVTVKAKQKAVSDVLSSILESKEMNYSMEGNHILLSKKENTNSEEVSTALAQQQKKQITGTVVDQAGDPVIGANIIEQGTTNGTITDIDGNFTLEVANNALIHVSYIGFIDQTLSAEGRTTFNIILEEDTKLLEEVVVVGYGTQAKKDITGSVAVVSAEDLAETPVATFAEALQGRASGVYISTTGAPGSGTTIRIRGVGSVNGSDPLIVVDGVSNVSIDAVNPNDIESLQVLKDASSTAIYGAQGANGVIIITTKQGVKDRVRVSYNGYAGVATMANNGFDLLNAWEAMEFQAQGLVNLRDLRNVTEGLTHSQFGSLDANDQLTMPYSTKPAGLSKEQVIAQFGSIEAWEASYKSNGANSWARSAYYQMLEDGYSEEEARKGTDWYDLVVQKGLVQEHQISVMGGGDRGSYSFSVGYTGREGTIKSSYFDRYSLRANSTFIPNEVFTIGQNTNLSVTEFGGERGTQGDDNIFARTYTIQPWVPVYNIGGDFAGSQSPEGGRANTAYQGVQIAKNNWNRRFSGQSAVFAEIKPIKGLSIRSQFSARLGGSWSLTFTPKTIATNKEGSSTNSLSESANYSLDWQWTNTATYATSFNDNHDFTFLLGTEAMKENFGRSMSGTRIDYLFENDPNTWILNNGSSSNVSNSGNMHNLTTMFGIFGRIDYSYQGKYLATLTTRRDASSKFSAKNRWATFPSISLGWRISEEPFMSSVRKTWLDDLKIRAGYGTSGNSNIGAYNYAFQYATGNNYMYSVTGSDASTAPGYAISNLGDPNAKWETIETINLGIDGTMIRNKLSLSLDFYVKNTTDMLVPANWSALAGNAAKPSINIGDMRNIGADFSFTWRDRIGDLRYNLTGNISTYKNKVVRLGSSDLFNNTRLNQINITTEGQPIGMFYGFNVVGIYKNSEDVLNYKNSNGQTVLPYAVTDPKDLNPDNWIGRYMLEDVNNDGFINAEDRKIIGNPHPDFTGGLNVSLNYKNFDLSTYLYFSIGNEIYRHYMYYTHFAALQSAYSRDRRDNSWHPTANPKGIYPLYATSKGEGTEAANESHSQYVQDGSYLRMQTLTLGYTLPADMVERISLDRIRIYGQISNVFTFTGYSGLEPEIRNMSDRAMGVDYGSYGVPRQFLLGINISF